MELIAFRIKNFRSIIDTGWVKLNKDRITTLIGQNESGKTSILEALNLFYSKDLSHDYLRSDRKYPDIICKFSFSRSEIKELLSEYDIDKIMKILKQLNYEIEFQTIWIDNEDYEDYFTQVELQEYFKQVEDNQTKLNQSNDVIVRTKEFLNDLENASKNDIDKSDQVHSNSELKTIDEFIFHTLLWRLIPSFEFFDDTTSLLPDQIDISDIIDEELTVKGIKGVLNFLRIVGIFPEELNKLMKEGNRFLANKLETINSDITLGFQKFWKQKIGKSNKIELEVELKHHDSNSKNPGKPYLEFWIKNGKELLYLKQRSSGVRWFLSFYLHLWASRKSANRIFLIDEPGGNLHAKAQNDVLRVFEELKKDVQIIYTTHSPYLIDFENIHRILAVQRKNVLDEESDTEVLTPQKLSSANTDTLTPMLTTMGLDLSKHSLISNDNNVILEELSGYYYFHAFKILTNSLENICFFPACGVGNVPIYANLFTGWGFNFVIYIDDDDSGRRTCNQLRKTLFINDEEAKLRLIKKNKCKGIEDIFSKTDFKKHIIGDSKIKLTESNSKYLKDKKISKPLTAATFYQKVKDGDITKNDLDKLTVNNITYVVNKISTSLEELRNNEFNNR